MKQKQFLKGVVIKSRFENTCSNAVEISEKYIFEWLHWLLLYLRKNER